MGELTTTSEDIKAEILRLTRIYSSLTHYQNRPADDVRPPCFNAGETPIPYAGRVFTGDEVAAGVNSMLDFWLTLGDNGTRFEDTLAKILGVKHSILVNSGSSANLVALSALTSYKLGKRRIKVGDQVITAAAGFPTTVAPIIQCGAVAVFLDVDASGNILSDQLDEAYVPGKTKAVMCAHSLGNPFNLEAVSDFCLKHDLWLVEDNCDALGSTYQSSTDDVPRLTGSWGDISTQSFYPPHHITLGEGGAVNVQTGQLKMLIESFRDWGRDCWCPSGKDDTCKKRFGWQLGELPEGYDHKYIYSHLGYNLKPLDVQAAIGLEQLKRLSAFVAARKANWQYLRKALDYYSDILEFALPTHATKWVNSDFEWEGSNRADCSWFGFQISVKPDAPFTRNDLAQHLAEKKIGNRMLFGGNLTRQPAFVRLKHERPDSIRTIGDLQGADRILNDTLFVGVYPGLTKAMLDYVIDVIATFIKSHYNDH